MVRKPLEILGDGPVSEIVIRARRADALLFQANTGRVANLTLRQAGGRGKWFGVNITQGRLDLEGCDISSQSLACIAIVAGADPRLRRNKIHGSPESGVIVYESGLGILEDNDITGNDGPGVAIKNESNPTLRRNKIHDNKDAGVFIYDKGLGTLEDNDITGNTGPGIVVQTNGRPIVRANRINHNGYQGISIWKAGQGVVEDNDLTNNKRGACYIAEDCKANVIRVRNEE